MKKLLHDRAYLILQALSVLPEHAGLYQLDFGAHPAAGHRRLFGRQAPVGGHRHQPGGGDSLFYQPDDFALQRIEGGFPPGEFLRSW